MFAALRTRYNRMLLVKAQVDRALRSIHDDAKVLEAWDNASEEQRQVAPDRLNKMIERSTGSINNSYLKVQITTGLVIGLLAVFLVIAQRDQVVWPLLVAGFLMNSVSIGLSYVITTPGARTTWTQEVKAPGIYALTQTPKEECLSLSKRAFHNRVVLLGNRRLAWLATWTLTLPGLVLALLSWAWLATLIALAALAVFLWFARDYLRAIRPRSNPQYPAV